MSRHFEPITVNELKTQIELCCIKDGVINYRHLTPTIEKDLDKVSFDTENITNESYQFGPKDLLGYQTLSNGMSFLGVCAGGDWESSVFFCIYWDGKKLRGYIPEKGNLWNTDTKQAYGNDNEADLKNARKRWPDDDNLKDDKFDIAGYLEDYDIEAMKDDIMVRIQEKTLTKPTKSSKVDVLPVYKPLTDFTDNELLGELKRRLGQKK